MCGFVALNGVLRIAGPPLLRRLVRQLQPFAQRFFFKVSCDVNDIIAVITIPDADASSKIERHNKPLPQIIRSNRRDLKE